MLFKEPRQDLGLSDYQMPAEEGVLHHLHVCCLAHLLLTHRGLEAPGEKARKPGEKARKPNKQVTLPPMSTRLADPRAHTARDHIERLVKGGQHAAPRQKLRDYLLAA